MFFRTENTCSINLNFWSIFLFPYSAESCRRVSTHTHTHNTKNIKKTAAAACIVYSLQVDAIIRISQYVRFMNGQSRNPWNRHDAFVLAFVAISLFSVQKVVKISAMLEIPPLYMCVCIRKFWTVARTHTRAFIMRHKCLTRLINMRSRDGGASCVLLV